ncbi:MAG: alpha/beta hydrolase [Gammaproteobacteria bacterium]|nr:alpha/beta hydrolase [Gammaproteobacteria bacterium]NNM13420.1 alpha/beta fold hydrolase [Gammaproteobacteria bacterium]
MDKRIFNPLFLTIALIGGMLTHNNFADSVVGDIEFTNCKVSDPTGKLQVTAECAVFSVPENYAQADAKKIDLHIARFKAKNEKDRESATTLLAGGPGQGAIESFVPNMLRLKKINTNQDIYLIDQRGTGKSNRMQCDTDNFDTTVEYDPEIVKEYTSKCLAGLPGDPRYYTTSVAMRDLDEIRKALGLEQWNLYGGSYGTRTAQHYLKQYPNRVRSVILDGLVSPDRPLGPEIALESQRALDDLLKRCSNDTDCSNAFPELEKNVRDLIDELKQESRQVTIENMVTGKKEDLLFTSAHLAGGIRMALYSPITMSILPNLLYEAAVNQHYGPLARQSINQTRQIADLMSMGMHNSVLCTEDADKFDDVQIDMSKLENSYLGKDFFDAMKLTCDIWPRGEIDEGFHELVTTDKPVLLLSGSVDPVTPPAYAEQAMQNMRNSNHIVLEGQGHIQMAVGCMPTILAKFIEQASFEEIETECLNKVKPEPFFIDFNGPTP